MGNEVTFVRAEIEHADALAAVLRPEDLAELRAGGHQDARALLLEALRVSDAAYAGIADREVAALFGAAPGPLPEVGIAWCLTGRAFPRHAKAFAKHAPWALELLFGSRHAVVNAVDARYAAALRWVRWLGFTVGEPVPVPSSGLPFHPIYLGRDAWAA